MKRISAIILSAGSSRRMGEPKALLQIGKKTFLQHIIDAAESSGVTDNVVVLGCEQKVIRETLSSFNGKIVINVAWEHGQLSSIITGVEALNLNDCDGALILPVDHPLISSALIRALMNEFEESGKKIIIPVYEGRRGHPLIISSDLFPEIKNASSAVGLREVIRTHSNDIGVVPTTEEGILLNIDTPDDYQKYVLNFNVEE